MGENPQRKPARSTASKLTRDNSKANPKKTRWLSLACFFYEIEALQ